MVVKLVLLGGELGKGTTHQEQRVRQGDTQKKRMRNEGWGWDDQKQTGMLYKKMGQDQQVRTKAVNSKRAAPEFSFYVVPSVWPWCENGGS